MKFISTLLFAFLFVSANGQQWKLTNSYSFGIPRQEMGKNIQPAQSLQTGILYQLPGKLKRLSIGVELGLGMYANETISQTFTFNNTSTVLPVDYSSDVFNANLQARFSLVSDKNFIIPYINVKGGLYNFYSSIFIGIGDPATVDDGSCHPIEQGSRRDRKNIINDKTIYWSAGSGLQVDLAILKRIRRKRGNLMIDISANIIRGGTLDYINTKHLLDAQDITDPDGKPLEVKFINASTSTIHEHTVAQVYTSPLRMLEFRAGITILFGNKDR